MHDRPIADVTSPNQTLLAQESSYEWRLDTRRRRQAASAAHRAPSLTHSSSFHAGAHHSLVTQSSNSQQLSPVAAADSFRQSPLRPRSMYADEARSQHYVSTSTPAARKLSHDRVGRVSSHFSDDVLMPPPPPPVSTTPRSSHVQTNGSLSYHQQLRRTQRHSCTESESDSDVRPSGYKRSLAFGPEQRVPPLCSSTSFTSVTAPVRDSLRSQSALDFRKLAALESSDSDTLSQRHINAALAHSLCLSDDAQHHVMSAAPSRTHHMMSAAPSRTHHVMSAAPAHTQGTNFDLAHAQVSDFGGPMQKAVSIDRPSSKLASKRHQAQHTMHHYSSPSPSLRTNSSNDTWSNTSLSARSPVKHQVRGNSRASTLCAVGPERNSTVRLSGQ